MADATDFNKAIGQRLAALRRAAGLTQEELSIAARVAGIEWSRTTVSSIEAGQRDLSAFELLVLPIVLQARMRRPGGMDPPGRSVRLADLLPENGDLLVGSQPRGAQVFRDLVSGKTATEATGFGIVTETDIAEAIGRAEASVTTAELAADSITITIDLSGPTEADGKAARSLGVAPAAIARAAHKLWRHSLVKERELRVQEIATSGVSQRSLQAIRGHVTRRLLAELRETLPSRARGKSDKGGGR